MHFGLFDLVWGGSAARGLRTLGGGGRGSLAPWSGSLGGLALDGVDEGGVVFAWGAAAELVLSSGMSNSEAALRRVRRGFWRLEGMSWAWSCCVVRPAGDGFDVLLAFLVGSGADMTGEDGLLLLLLIGGAMMSSSSCSRVLRRCFSPDDLNAASD